MGGAQGSKQPRARGLRIEGLEGPAAALLGVLAGTSANSAELPGLCQAPQGSREGGPSSGSQGRGLWLTPHPVDPHGESAPRGRWALLQEERGPH